MISITFAQHKAAKNEVMLAANRRATVTVEKVVFNRAA